MSLLLLCSTYLLMVSLQVIIVTHLEVRGLDMFLKALTHYAWF